MFGEASIGDREEIRDFACRVIQTSDSADDRQTAIKIVQLIDSLDPESVFEAYIIKALMQLKRTDQDAHRALGTSILVAICGIFAIMVLLAILP